MKDEKNSKGQLRLLNALENNSKSMHQKAIKKEAEKESDSSVQKNSQGRAGRGRNKG